MKPIRTLLLMISLLLIKSWPASAQVERASLIGAYTYNFACHTAWPQEKNYDQFKIVLISDNDHLIREFNTFTRVKKVKNKPIILEVSSGIPDNLPEDVRMVVLPREKKELFDALYQKMTDRPILLVSENYSNQRKVMINLYETQQQEILFEVNKANILNHFLQIDPEILLMGGTEIDIAELYRSSQKSLDSMQKRLDYVSDSLLHLNERITHSILQIALQQDSIIRQKNLLEEQKSEMGHGLQEIKNQQSRIDLQKDRLDHQQILSKKQEAQLNEQLIEISEQQSFNQKQQEEILKSRSTLDSLFSEIDQKNVELIEQGELIKRQKRINLLTALAGILSIIVLITLISGFRSKVRKNQLLTKQKEQIEQINSRLSATNRSLYETIKRLSETQSQLVASEKMASLGVLTAGIAHEINNPVNFIYTGINSLKKDMDELFDILSELNELVEKNGDKELISQLETIKTDRELNEIREIIPQTIEDIKIGAERAADIIRGLRNFSRIDKDARQYFDVHEGIDSTLLLLRNKFKNFIHIVKEYKQLPKIECFPGKLNQAFMNILSNSIDAIEGNGTITIHTWQEKETRIFIEIKDTGKGIANENLGKIFDPFFTTKNVGKGVGLGLSITYGIINDHNGTIDVKSEINKGTTFTISLPCTMKFNKTE